VERESGYYTRITGGQADVVALLGAAETPIVSFGAMLGTMIVAYTSVMQRRTEIGVLRARLPAPQHPGGVPARVARAGARGWR
jgi:hypothetical protein